MYYSLISSMQKLSDAQKFILIAGITDTTQKLAINTLFSDLKNAGLYDKFYAIYPFIGGIENSHKFNLKDPRDDNSALRLTFTAGWTHDSNGITPNGTSASANTYFISGNYINLTDLNHLSYYSRTNTAKASEYVMGNNNQGMIIRRDTNLSNYYSYLPSGTTNSYVTTTNLKGQGFFIGSQQDVNNIKFFRNKTLLAQNSGNFNANFDLIPLVIGASNFSGTPLQFTDKNCAFASIGKKLSDSEIITFYNIIENYQTILNRQINPPTVSDIDAQSFIDSADIINISQANAVNNLVINLKSYNLWSKMKAIYPFVGGNPTSHKFNLKDPRDLPAAFTLQFNGGFTHNLSGVQGNGLNSFANTFLNTKNILTPNNLSIGLYTNTNRLTNSSVAYGNSDNTSTYIPLTQLYLRTSNNLVSDLGDYNFGRVTFINNTTAGFYVNSRTASNSMKVYKNNILTGSSTINNTTNILPNSNLYMSAFNANGSNTSWETINFQFFYVSDGLNDTEASNLYTSVQAFQTALGRNI